MGSDVGDELPPLVGAVVVGAVKVHDAVEEVHANVRMGLRQGLWQGQQRKSELNNRYLCRCHLWW